MLRFETKSRARALQLLYAWELQGGPGTGPGIPELATGLARITGPEPRILDRAEALATDVVKDVRELDAQAARAAENWRMERIAAVERNILRLGIHELRRGDVPTKVAIDEAVRLAHWFGGVRAGGFVNGVLDAVARTLGKL
jgi:N utilization substance protein B